MKTLQQVILEAEEKKKVTREWMVEHYREFNEKYFNNELPQNISLEVKSSLKNEHWLGCQGFDIRWYASPELMENGKYIMYYRKKSSMWTSTTRKWVDVPDENSRVLHVKNLHPHIYISARYVFTETEMEDTLIHEMVHLYTYKDGLAPKRAHGKEFKAKCKEIRELAKSKYGKNYHLTTYATDNTQYEPTEEIKQQISQQEAERAGKYATIMFDTPNDTPVHRVLFCSTKKVDDTIAEIKYYHNKNVTNIRVSASAYGVMCARYGKFRTSRGYRTCYYADKYTDTLNSIKDWKDK